MTKILCSACHKASDEFFLSPAVDVAQDAAEPDHDQDKDMRCGGASRSKDCAVRGVRRKRKSWKSVQNHADKVHTRSLLSHSGCTPYTDTSCRPGARVRRGPEWRGSGVDGGDAPDSLGTVIGHACADWDSDDSPPFGCWPTLPCGGECGWCSVLWDKVLHGEAYVYDVGSDGSELCWANETAVSEDEGTYIDVRYACKKGS